ncbi:MAG: translation initiation factor IF-3 C-terminal domain-containing protein, partial [Acidimicrobiales bacterium]
VKVTVMFRGREVFHSDLGKRILDRIGEQIDGTGRIESEARLDGKNMVMVIAPDRRARQSAVDRAAPEGENGGGADTAATGAPAAPSPAPGEQGVEQGSVAADTGDGKTEVTTAETGDQEHA